MQRWWCNNVLYSWKAVRNYSKIFSILIYCNNNIINIRKCWILINEAVDPKYVKKYVNDQTTVNLDAGDEIISNTEVLKSNLCDYIHAYILIKDDITTAHNPTPVAFKISALFTITMADGTSKDDDEDLDLFISKYNLTEYS